MAYYEFTNVFYLPACEPLRFEEGFARLDHAQPVLVNHLARHRGLKLSEDALAALVEWFMAYTTDRIPEDSLILAYRREVIGGG
jgi:hypothetical protein